MRLLLLAILLVGAPEPATPAPTLAELEHVENFHLHGRAPVVYSFSVDGKRAAKAKECVPKTQGTDLVIATKLLVPITTAPVDLRVHISGPITVDSLPLSLLPALFPVDQTVTLPVPVDGTWCAELLLRCSEKMDLSLDKARWGSPISCP